MRHVCVHVEKKRVAPRDRISCTDQRKKKSLRLCMCICVSCYSCNLISCLTSGPRSTCFTAIIRSLVSLSVSLCCMLRQHFLSFSQIRWPCLPQLSQFKSPSVNVSFPVCIMILDMECTQAAQCTISFARSQ